MRKCSECLQDKPDDQFYTGYARCKVCTSEDTVASRKRYLIYMGEDEWPDSFKRYMDSRRAYAKAGGSVPEWAKPLITGGLLTTDIALNPDTIRDLAERLSALEREVRELKELVDAAPQRDHTQETLVGEIHNLYVKACKEIDQLPMDDVDREDIKAGLHGLNAAVTNTQAAKATDILNIVLTLSQYNLAAPATVILLYRKFYKQALGIASESDKTKTVQIAGVDLYETDWEEFLQE